MWAARLVVGLSLASRAASVLVAEGSPCRSLCGNTPDSTTEDDIVCPDTSFAEEDAGILYQQCVTCELTSNYHTEDNRTDVDALLYNLRYSLSYCVFGVPENDDVISGPCRTSQACEDFLPGFTYSNLSTNIDSYDHCENWPESAEEGYAEHNHLQTCTTCLRVQGYHYLANFVTVLEASCQQKPEPGVSVAIEGDVFSSDYANVTDPTPEASVDPDWFDNGPLDVGAKAGIAASGVVVLLALAGCCIVWRGKRRRRAFLRNYNPGKSGLRTPAAKGWPSSLQVQGMQDVSDTPLSQRPLRAWDDSPQSSRSDQPFPRYVSPYSSHYSSPVSGSDAHPPMPQWPVLGVTEQQMQAAQQQQESQRSVSIGLALGGDTPVDNGAPKGKDKAAEEAEAYEMHRVDSSRRSGTVSSNSPTTPSEPYFSHARTYSGSYRNFSGRRGSGI